ncbi:MAG: hypothetical protein NPINA01_15760 [Nitrospinaceae bacterium]|nr:MAG: hypothetical protein NPINA01_15760 [Nitrospinaceae bacterium]
MKRKKFLSEFLGALGAVKIERHHENDSLISGKVIYNSDDPNEAQEFRWRIPENEVPSEEVRLLAKLLKEENLLSIDKIIVTRKELGIRYNAVYGIKFTEQEFNKILDDLESVEVSMVDNDKETDVYFIHE